MAGNGVRIQLRNEGRKSAIDNEPVPEVADLRSEAQDQAIWGLAKVFNDSQIDNGPG